VPQSFSLMITDLNSPALMAPASAPALPQPRTQALRPTTAVPAMPMLPPPEPEEPKIAAEQQQPPASEGEKSPAKVDWAKFASAVASIRGTKH